MTRRVEVFAPAEYAARAARVIGALIVDAIQRRGRCALALAGGSTPLPVYRVLAGPAFTPAIPWPQVHVYFGDERAVPPDDPASNFGAARAALLDLVPIPAAQVHRMEGERADREAAARAYEALLPDRLDLILLGIGPDGHTASLFPGSGALDETGRRVVPVTGPKPPSERLSITPPVLAAAREVVVLVTGADKAGVVARVLDGVGPVAELPVRVVKDRVWLLDRAAGATIAG